MTVTIFAMIMAMSMMVAALITVRNAPKTKQQRVRRSPYQNWK